MNTAMSRNPATEAALAADPAEAEPAAGDREGAGVVAEHADQSPAIEKPMRIRYSITAMPTWVRAVILMPTIATVVGILKQGVQLPSAADVWVPKVFSPTEMKQRGAVYFAAIGRLAPGVTLRRARAEADVIGRRLSTQYPDGERELLPDDDGRLPGGRGCWGTRASRC